MNSKTQKIVLTALFIALSAIGAQLKIFSSIAFDSLPAFLAAFLLGGPQGAIVGALGHILTAALSGFPYTLPLHIVIALEMAGICYIAGWLVHKKKMVIWLAAIIAFVLNAFISPLILIVWPGFGWAVCVTLFLPLALGSAANAAGAAILAYLLKSRLFRKTK